MPKLDDRLTMVAGLIRSRVHADIGSDHGHLLKALLLSGRIDHGIAIENKRHPLDNSRRTLHGLDADIRLADGLEGLRAGEAESVSLCGMGGELITRILDSFPDRVPDTVIVQPNLRADLVRRWALQQHFHLSDEQFVPGRQEFVVLRFNKNHWPIETELSDPAYAGLDHQGALLFGPLLIRRWEPTFVGALQREHDYLSDLPRLTAQSQRRLDALKRLLSGHCD